MNRFARRVFPLMRAGRQGNSGAGQGDVLPEQSVGDETSIPDEDANDVISHCGDDAVGNGDNEVGDNDVTSQTQAGSSTATDSDPLAAEPHHSQANPGVRVATVMGLITAVALAALTGWLAFHAHQEYELQQQRQLYLQVGRQAAINLTTINYTEVDTDVQRILDSATGAFRDEFAQRSTAFIEVVKRAQSKSEGTVTAAGLESVDGDHAQVVVAVTVKTAMPAVADEKPRGWRMRISVQKDGGGAKVSSVGFVQ